MFNPVSAAVLTAELSKVLRESSDWNRPLDPFESAQLRSASSVARYLSAQLAGGAAAWHRFRTTLDELLADELARAAGDGTGEWEGVVAETARRLAALDDPTEVGTLLAELLDAGRTVEDAAFLEFRAKLHAAFRVLVDDEVAVLSSDVRSGR